MTFDILGGAPVTPLLLSPMERRSDFRFYLYNEAFLDGNKSVFLSTLYTFYFGEN